MEAPSQPYKRTLQNKTKQKKNSWPSSETDSAKEKLYKFLFLVIAAAAAAVAAEQRCTSSLLLRRRMYDGFWGALQRIHARFALRVVEAAAQFSYFKPLPLLSLMGSGQLCFQCGHPPVKLLAPLGIHLTVEHARERNIDLLRQSLLRLLQGASVKRCHL